MSKVLPSIIAGFVVGFIACIVAGFVVCEVTETISVPDTN